VLDEVPPAERARPAAAVAARGAAFWAARARMQVEATLYRLVYRNFYYGNKGQLPLPPAELWDFTIDGPPARREIDGHDVVAVQYTFRSTLLTSHGSAIESDRAFASVGGTWGEPFLLPVDPEHIFERTGYACMDEEDFPPNSVDSENARFFYDDYCLGGWNSGCHVTQPAPKESCAKAIARAIGGVSTTMSFTRLPWDAALADSVRVGTPGGPTALEVLSEGLEDNRVEYRYVPADSCAIAEGCVGGPGWRRLLKFTATLRNNGGTPAHVGDVSEDAAVIQNNMFEFSACHGHMHFSHYGAFSFDTGSGIPLGSKQAFCLESTSRYLNNETTPLTHPYGCYYQGIEAGWGDDYIAGIECQWVDVTSVDTAAAPVSGALAFDANPDGFLCEGSLVVDAEGNPTFEPTQYQTETGEVVHRFACDESDGWADDNRGETDVTLSVDGSYVTEPCRRGQLGHLRNCGFREQDDRVACEPGGSVRLDCVAAAGARPQAVRFCERSEVLGTGIACSWDAALAGGTVAAGAATRFTFTCPGPRDAHEPGGAYALYTAPAFPDDAAAPVTCTPR
ncbi:MAG TPA: lysyl oxidase family protein, partial [Kofleriaceae bacterium]|nr:lysyl oxidase family protein [Kofleriaceae bacterium]